MPQPLAVEGNTILRVGERDPKDKKYAPDEFVFAAPGTVVAPRPRDMEPTMENAVQALMETALKSFMGGRSGTPKGQRKIGKKVKKAEQGASAGELFAGSEFLRDLLDKLLTDDVGRLGIPQLQQQIMESLGFVAPSLYAQTDPALFRQGLTDVMRGKVQALPTLAAQRAFTGILAPMRNPVQGPYSVLREDMPIGEQAGVPEVPMWSGTGPGPLDLLPDGLPVTSPTTKLGPSASRPAAPPATIPTLASKALLADRILKALGGNSVQGRQGSFGLV